LNFLSLFYEKILSIMQLQINDLRKAFKYRKTYSKSTIFIFHSLICEIALARSCGPTWVITPIKSAKEFCEPFRLVSSNISYI
jgi:hypothetical protein